MTVLINNNTVQEVGNGSFTGFEGIFAIKSVTAGTLNATVTNNTMDQIRDDRGLQVRSILGTVCSDIRGNQFSNIAGSTFLRVSQAVPGVFNLVQTSQANLRRSTTLPRQPSAARSTSERPPTARHPPARRKARPLATQPVNRQRRRQPRPVAAMPASRVQPVPRLSSLLRSTSLSASVSTAITPAMAAVAGDDQFNHSTVPSRSRLRRDRQCQRSAPSIPPSRSPSSSTSSSTRPQRRQQIVSQVCNQGTFTGGNFSNVLTDDPDVGGAANPTCTTLALGSITIAKDQVPDGSTVFGFTSTIPGNAAFNVNGDTLAAHRQRHRRQLHGHRERPGAAVQPDWPDLQRRRQRRAQQRATLARAPRPSTWSRARPSSARLPTRMSWRQ